MSLWRAARMDESCVHASCMVEKWQEGQDLAGWREVQGVDRKNLDTRQKNALALPTTTLDSYGAMPPTAR